VILGREDLEAKVDALTQSIQGLIAESQKGSADIVGIMVENMRLEFKDQTTGPISYDWKMTNEVKQMEKDLQRFNRKMEGEAFKELLDFAKVLNVGTASVERRRRDWQRQNAEKDELKNGKIESYMYGYNQEPELQGVYESFDESEESGESDGTSAVSP
jgi:hypothetical protein